MIKVNEYFDGKVKSLGFQGESSAATVGVMAAGDYEFGTGSPEVMTVISGELVAKLPGAADWQTFTAGSSFNVPGDSKFQLKVARDTAYLCEYR
ncbi:MAG: pyrimidine/purine nucleoside phosphorylase [Gammaproteobacteria bacterium]|nr:pyrimidine/purine nucleoside phosphorylase [Gammaproteobacteria bacterium]